MSEQKYIDLLTVKVGENLKVARCTSHKAHKGDLVNLDTGEQGTVVARIFCEDGGEEYVFIANIVPIWGITAIYTCAWSQEEHNEPA
jgi:hypothetical protein